MRGAALLLTGSFALCGPGLSAQGPVKAHVQEAQGGTLRVVAALPDSFPLVGLVLRAEDGTGTPLWDLRREDVGVFEDGVPCAITCLYPITYPEPIHIGLVIDHSGSMAFDGRYLEDTLLQLSWMLDASAYQRFLDTTAAPLDHARNGVSGFIRAFDATKDRIAITAFSSQVDVRVPLTNDTALLHRTVEGLRPTESTAFHDAVLAGLAELRGARGLRVLVAMTDGLDNASRATLDEVITQAAADSVRVFTIGLGSANGPALDSLAHGTGGRSWFTHEAGMLTELYAEIGRNIQAYYHLTYRSGNLASADTSRDVEVAIDFGGERLTDRVRSSLPPAVRALLAEAEHERLWTWGGGAAALLALAGGVVLFRYRRGPKRSISRVWPVPTDGELFIELDAPGGALILNDATLSQHKVLRISSGLNRYDLSALLPGTYTLSFTAPGRATEVHRFIKR